jgi:branched-chain amino acid aminotransferase
VTVPTGDQFAAGCAWIEGSYVPIAEARIPILDTGFTRSDLTYDVVGVWDGRFFRLDDHLDRLFDGCAKLRMDPPLKRDAVADILTECVRRSGLRNSYVEVIVTRGVPAPGQRDPRQFDARIYAYAIPYVWIVTPEDQLVGTSLVIARGTQRIDPQAVDPTIKNFHWGDLVRGLFEAYDRGSWLPVLTDRHDNITEGPGFNVFAVVDGQLCTPAHGVLHGITRRTVVEIAAAEHLPTVVRDIQADELHSAEEIFLTSTAGGVMPVATLDGEPVGDGKPGPITTLLRQRYWDLHAASTHTTEISYPQAS